jgi:hypothetical protein
MRGIVEKNIYIFYYFKIYKYLLNIGDTKIALDLEIFWLTRKNHLVK